ncbi:APC family permease [Pandoraea anhela]|uniref:Porin n=1 Tax=Pandoraea anhela TaxID=2508295 RepID=A0A5E4Y706_9BURK|nr:APC family permease [Pandoraea anhela]VVE44105.1 porin [Pandoraea anhela]
MTVESFGYTQELKRVLSFRDLIVYGMLWMIPVSPFGIYGFVSDASHGMVALAYLAGVIAMALTAVSYQSMSAAFPLAGSVYTYAQRGIGPTLGFMAGWLILLDYLLIPSLLYIGSAAALAPMFPELPRWGWILLFAGIGAGINLLGMEFTARAGKWLLALQLLVLSVFCVTGLYALYFGHVGAGRLTMAPWYQPAAFSLSAMFSAVAIAAVSFLGFDAISTMSEEVRAEGKGLVGRATLASLFVVGALFILQTWIAADLGAGHRASAPETAFYEIAEFSGGHWLYVLTSCTTVLAWGVANSLVSTASIARILFSMARDRQLPSVLARISPVRRVPYVSILLVAVISLVVSLAFMEKLDQLTRFVNFGALTGFLMLHVAVVNHFVRRNRSTQWLRHLVVPVVGFVVVAAVLYAMGRDTWVLGLGWLAVGGIYYAILTRVLRQRVQIEV